MAGCELLRRTRPGPALLAGTAASSPAVPAGLVLILRSAPGIEVTGEAADGEQAVAPTCELRPDVVVMDIQMPLLDGASATLQVVAERPADILALTTFDLDEYVFGALRAGAAGFLLKSAEARELVEAVRTVARGEGIVVPAVTRRLFAEFAAAPAREAKAVPAAWTPCPPREREVLSRLGEGLSNAGIALRLDLVPRQAAFAPSRH